MSKEEKVYWLRTAEEGKKYETTTYYRCVGIENFIKKLEEKYIIIGFMFSDNNLGFVVEKK